MKKPFLYFTIVLFLSVSSEFVAQQPAKPNVVLILTEMDASYPYYKPLPGSRGSRES
jgi:hypothetical protein